MSINTLLRSALEDAVQEQSDDVVPVASVAMSLINNLSETASPIEIAEELDESEKTIDVIGMITDRVEKAESDTTLTEEAVVAATESAAFAWEVMCHLKGISSNSVSLESHAMGSAMGRVTSAAVESLASDSKALSERFDGSLRAIADASAVMTRVKREVQSAAPLIDGSNATINMAGVVSFMSRNFAPVDNILNALIEEERHIDSILSGVKDLQDQITKASAVINKLSPSKDEMTSILRIIDGIQYDKVYSKLLNLDLLHSGVLSVDSFDESNIPLLCVHYHNIKDGSAMSKTGWIKIGAIGALSGLATAVSAALGGPLAVGVGIIGGLTIGSNYAKEKQKSQGANTNYNVSAKDLEKILDVSSRILAKGTEHRRQVAEIKIATNTMYRVADTFAKYAKENDKSWQDVATTGMQLAATVAMAVATKGNSGANYVSDDKVPPIVSELQSKIYWVGLSHDCMLDILYGHIGIVGTGTLSLANSILKAVGRDKAK